jgi:N-acetylglutamate synthase-like GNAT family acetyltransferase
MSSEPTIRSSTAKDVSAIRRLMSGDVDPSTLVAIPGRRHVLVLDAPNGGLAGAASFVLDSACAHLTLLAIASEYQGSGLEDRFIAVIEAMCKAFGAKCLDIPARRAA